MRCDEYMKQSSKNNIRQALIKYKDIYVFFSTVKTAKEKVDEKKNERLNKNLRF